MANDVEKIKSRLDIVDVIGEYVRLKQSGQNWKGNCPFHHEKTPSFMVHREKQIWHCFGCGEGGDVFSFVQKIENVDFPEALEILARKAQVELEPRGGRTPESGQRQKFFQAVDWARQFYQEQLKNSPQGATARDYLKTRQLSADSIATFAIGYAPPEWDRLLVFLRGKGFTVDEIVAAGLALKSERGPGAYDRFRDRLMFPINDNQGRTVGFGGRTLNPDAKEAKYINSPQGPIYNKSALLYNLDRAKNYIKETSHAVLVEGYMDVIGSWQAGVQNVVATSGTALTPEQVKLLKRYTNEIKLSFDADLAGQSASERGIDLALQAELEVKVIILPFGKDPDECAKKDAAAFRQAVTQAVPIGDYAFKMVLGKVDPKTREGKKEAARRLLAAITKLPDPVERDHYIKRLARELDVDERSLRERLGTVSTSTTTAGASTIEPVTSTISDRHQLLSHRLLSITLLYGDELLPKLRNLGHEPLWGDNLRQLYKHLTVYYNERQRFDFEELKLELQLEPELSRLLDILFLQAERDFAGLEGAQVAREFDIIFINLKSHYLSLELKKLSASIGEAERAGQAEVLQELLTRFAAISRELTALNSQ